MQQPMNQPEPIGGQQAVQQQMVLCPVRFVYETQVLVQPGDQIQPNQTFFINPQNPPPWMQNRPQPNPVVYVQQLPNNMIQPVQQQMDQNQLYLQQNFANFQLQQHMLAQNHPDMRSVQLTNIVPNMVQNVQQSIQSNERNINQNPNTGQIQANAQNIIQNQMTVARQVPSQGNQTVDVQRQVQFMNVRPQVNQQVNITRPVMSLNQLQNMQAMTNMQNLQIQQANTGQTFVQNIGQRMPQNVNAVRPQILPNNAMNVQNVNNINKPTNQPPLEANKAMNNTVGSPVPNVRNFAQNYNCRPIQPRRRFVENNANNLPKMQQQNIPVQQPKIQQQNVPQIVQQQQHIPVQTPPTQQQHQYNQERVNIHQIATNTAAATNYLNNPNISRKRKSESPDGAPNKMAVPPASQPIYKNLQQGIIITKLCNEIGTNTSPVHKPKLVANNLSNQAAQMNQSMSMVIVENTEQSKQDVNQIKTETKTVITPAPSESDKLIRNTVFTQARGRLLQDKISDNTPKQVIENKPPESVQNTTEIKTNIEAQTDNNKVTTEVPTDNNKAVTEVPADKNITVTIQSEKGATVTKTQAETIESRIMQILDSIPKNKNTQTPDKKHREVKKEEVSKEIKIEGVKKNENGINNDNNASKTIKVVAATKSEPKSETQEKKVEIKERKPEVKHEKVAATEKVITKQDILTHVVDGYVIQESNFAFPIRKPLIEKTLQANPKAEAESMDALKECMKEEMKNTEVDVQLLPFHYLLLHCEKKKEEEEMADSKTLNPFTDLQHSTVKSWTIEELSNHLLKYDWNDTVSVFQDHEIDDKQNTLDEANRISSGIDRYGEEPEIPVKYDTKASKIIQDVGNVVTEFETSGNSSNYFEEEVENPVNESEIDEDTEQELQGNDEFNSDCGGIGEHAQMLQANDEHTGSLQENKEEVLLKQNDKLKMEILEDVVLKRPNKSHAEILKTIKEIIVYKKGNSSTDDVTTAKVFDHIKQINYGKDTILQANDKVNSNIIYFGEEIENAANKLGVDDKTEQVLQGNKEFKDDSHKIIELVQISQENNDHTKILNEIKQVDISKPNDKLKVKILEDTMVKCAVKSHTEILNSLKEIILFTNDKSSSKIDGIDDVTAQKLFGHNSTAYKHINNGKDTILQVNRKINRNAKGIHNIDPKNNERMAENISTRSRESQVTGKFNNEISEKALKFDNFKVPKEVAISKKKRIKKQQRRFVLTHVVGGHIIQESNFPFPIREPQNLNLKKIKVCQKNKPQSCNTKGTAPSIKVLEEKKVIREENKTETPDHTKANEDKRFIQVETLIEKTEEVANIKEGCGPEGKVVQEETVTEEPTPIEKTEEVANIKEGCRPEEKVVQEETVTEGPTPIEKTEEVANIKEDCVIEEKVIQEKTVTEEPTPTEVTVVKENCVAGEPALTEVKEDGEDPPASISSLLDVANGELNPFTSLKRSTVKSWTVEALSNHLLKCEWEETASLLQDNEIDGESLFMVTKTQLMIIGVNEEQADIISEFIQSGSPKGH